MAYQDKRSGFDRERDYRRKGDDRRGGHPFVSDRWDSEEQTQDRRDSFRNRDRSFSRQDREPRQDRFERRSDRDRPFSRQDRETRQDRFGRRADRSRPFGSRFGERKERGAARYSQSEIDYNKSIHAENDRKKAEGYIRLNRYIANSGVCSRREADEMIASGVITVNGEVCTVLGTLVGPNDKVQFGQQTLNAEKKVYLLLNKPKGYITTSDDPQERKTVMDIVGDACRERIYPVGRLDRNTTGVLLFTNDGDMAKRLTHPSHGARKIYHVTLDNPLSKGDLTSISKGVELEDGWVEIDEISYVEAGNRKEVGIQLHSGKNRVVRRIFEHFGYAVTKLDRVLFAELTKKDLKRGAWRFLTEQEVNFLMMNAGKAEAKATPKSRKKESIFTPEQLAEAELLAEETPVSGRKTKAKSAKKTVEAEEETLPAFIKPRTRKAAETEEAAEEEKPKRKTTRKKAAETEEAAEEKPKRKTTRKKAE